MFKLKRAVFPKEIAEYTARGRAAEFLTLRAALASADVLRTHIPSKALGDTNTAMAYAYALGMVDGKRAERARRKGGVKV